MIDFKQIIANTGCYNFHSHTQFCDGHAPMEVMARAACEAGMQHYGFSPHSPINVASPCNMSEDSVEAYLAEADRVARLMEAEGYNTHFYRSMEIDRMSHEWGPHIDYFQRMPLDYRIGSVHFVPNQDGVMIDCDGSFERFERNLRDGYRGDVRYVVEKYYESVLGMLEDGGIDILGHFDKIAANAGEAWPELEEQGWYEALVDDVVNMAVGNGVAIEINTKSIDDRKRLFPALKWWDKCVRAGAVLVVNSDAHWPEKVNLGRDRALSMLSELQQKNKSPR